MQQNDRHAPALRGIGHAQTGQRQLDVPSGLLPALRRYIFAQVAATFGADQGDGKQVAAALHNALAQKRAASGRSSALYSRDHL
jgi:hypothetical protein